METTVMKEIVLGNSAKPFDMVIVPDYETRRLSAVHIIRDELIRVEPITSATSKYPVMINVIE